MSAALAPSPCPSEDLVAALCEGRLEESAATELRGHIDACATCLATVAALASMSRPALDATLPAPGGDEWAAPPELDGFRLVRPLGRGGMGRVFLAHEVSLDRPVAIKVLASARPDATALARFLLEARAIARLSHPNVVAIYRIGEVQGRPYLAYEYVDGTSLDRVAKPMPWSDVLAIALGLARGLAAAHHRDVLHRDIKPANAILSASGDVKLLDFGLAKLAFEAQPESRTATEVIERLGAHGAADLTATGAMLGTPMYMAPELWAGEAATARSDIYSLGLVLHELATGARPRGDIGLAELARRTLNEDVPPVRKACPSMPEALARVLDRCTARRPEARFGAAAEVKEALEEVETLLRAFRPARSDRPDRSGPFAGVHESFARVAPRSETLVAEVYRRLFTARPELRSLFPVDMSEQRMKLGSALRLAIDNLESPAVLEPMLEDLGRRHAAKGVRPEHFATLGDALLGALEAMEGERWSAEIAVAWSRAFGRVAEVMMRGIALAEREAAEREALEQTIDGPPETQFTQSGDALIAYQILGSGPIDVIVMPVWVTHVEVAWQSPRYARLVRGIAADARLIVYDQRGAGLSERSRAPVSNEERIEDLLAVMDAAGSARAVLLGASTAAGLALLFAERHPDRTRGVAITCGSPGVAAVPELAAAFEEHLRNGWGGPVFFDVVAPSAAGDEAFRRWWATYLRTGSSPSVAIALRRIEEAAGFGDRPLAITAPAIVVHRSGDRVTPIEASRRLAKLIPGARHVELPGEDHLVLAGDVDALVAEIRGFLREIGDGDGDGSGVMARRA